MTLLMFKIGFLLFCFYFCTAIHRLKVSASSLSILVVKLSQFGGSVCHHAQRLSFR